MLKLTREAAVELFEALGITSAAKWNAKRMAAKLAKVDEMVDEDTALEGTADATLTSVLEAIEADDDIEVAGKAPAAKKGAAPAAEAKADAKADAKPTAAEKKAAKAKADKATAAAEKKEAAATAKAEKDAAKAAKKEAKDEADKAKAAEAKAKKDAQVPGVRATRTRPYLAGMVVARHGLKAGVTPEMVAELDEEYGKVNPVESTWCLKSAWHAARGYCDEQNAS